MLNSIQTKKIFDKYSFLMGSEDVISTIKATDLFGKDAVVYAIRAQAEGIKTITMSEFVSGIRYVYLTYAGFQQAVTYLNRQELIEHDKKLSGVVSDSEDTGWYEVKEGNKIISFEGRRKQA